VLLPSPTIAPAAAGARLPVRLTVTAATQAAALRRGRTARLVVLPWQLGPGRAVVSSAAAPQSESESVTAALGPAGRAHYFCRKRLYLSVHGRPTTAATLFYPTQQMKLQPNK
jgi:hypothetical protein